MPRTLVAPGPPSRTNGQLADTVEDQSPARTRGGKSTFLRSVGLAQLMMQAGMFVAAESFTASVSAGEPLPTSYGEDLYQEVFGGLS